MSLCVGDRFMCRSERKFLSDLHTKRYNCASSWSLTENLNVVLIIFHDPVHMTPPPDPILNQAHQVHSNFSWPCSHDPTTWPYPEQGTSSALQLYILTTHFNIKLLYQLRIYKRPLSFKFLQLYLYSHTSQAFSQLNVLYSAILRVFTWITTFVYPLFTSIDGGFPLFTSSNFCDTLCHTYMYSRLCKWSNTRRSSLFSSLRCRCLEQGNSWASDHLLTFPSSIQLDWAIGSGPKNSGPLC
jgi:hypothetical protein